MPLLQSRVIIPGSSTPEISTMGFITPEASTSELEHTSTIATTIGEVISTTLPEASTMSTGQQTTLG